MRFNGLITLKRRRVRRVRRVVRELLSPWPPSGCPVTGRFASQLLIEQVCRAESIDGSHQHERCEYTRYQRPPPEQVPYCQGNEEQDEEPLEPLQGSAPEVVDSAISYVSVGIHAVKIRDLGCEMTGGTHLQ